MTKKEKFEAFKDAVIQTGLHQIWFRTEMFTASDYLKELERGEYPDTEADGYVFCGKCGKMKSD